MKKNVYDNYIRILRAELIPAMGCTEPIAIAYASAKARELLGEMPEKMTVLCSGNIIKNVKGVCVPNSGGQKGVEAAAVLGAYAGDPDGELQVLSHVSAEQAEDVRRMDPKSICICELAEGVENLYVKVDARLGKDSACAELKGKHNHISLLEKNGEVLFSQEDIPVEETGDKSLLNMDDIKVFADSVDIAEIGDVIKGQIRMNSAISEEGLRNVYGAAVGKTLMETRGEDVAIRAAARAAAGSDARMNGCPLPVVINSGSGNQGITCTMPVVTYAEEMGAGEEKLIRALVFTNLISLHQKYYIGNLSAYCGAISAGTSAACGIAYLNDAGMDVIEKTIVNSLCNVGGIVCDGAKASCAAKIASAVTAGIRGYEMALRGRYFPSDEGIAGEDCEQTIRNFGRLAKDGMRETDIEILHMMIEN